MWCAVVECVVVWCGVLVLGQVMMSRAGKRGAGQGRAHFHSVASCVAKSTDCDIFTQLLRLS